LTVISVEHEVNVSSKIRRGTIQENLLEDCIEYFPESGKTTRRETPLCSVISDEENRKPVAMATPAN
jgi:predicted ATP-grasp superfamily ATP-dependent carboligase